MSEGTTTHRPLSQDDWKFIFAVVEGTKLDVPRIRAEVARLAAAEARAGRYRHLIADIKLWDVSELMSIPHLLRERIQSAIDEGEAG